ncbi:hypothetical protein HUE87_08790 [Candidatus Sulfurimonas marisnigri]|uniref:Uncharacterized protein n=1 Tax=Candidatus Sulfurimonas marisnigri TaxID=2740405 RepID=A0A7S7LZY0_9BACT|nr:hypothetical protein [Candidatus Sulfurimonas marisnigri]QOY53988.1 hypothetical protein HUE87_08790 [Candidatus Sulfurimonas marisnigri]
MRRDEKRQSYGTLLPNIFFSLQVIAILLILSLIVQFVELFNLAIPIILISCFIAIGFVFYFLIRRKNIIQRQDIYHKK